MSLQNHNSVSDEDFERIQSARDEWWIPYQQFLLLAGTTGHVDEELSEIFNAKEEAFKELISEIAKKYDIPETELSSLWYSCPQHSLKI